jgi:hypothetical protein
MPEHPELVTIATFGLRHEAEIARAVLDSAGIESSVVADDEGGLNPGFYRTYGIRLIVGADDAEDAAALLDDAGS